MIKVAVSVTFDACQLQCCSHWLRLPQGSIPNFPPTPLSADYSRSNWCPGASVQAAMCRPNALTLAHWVKSPHQLPISMPEAQAATENAHNGRVVSAYIVYALYFIGRPPLRLSRMSR